MNNKLGQLIFIGLEGTELTDKEAKFIVDNNIGGVTLFGRNLESPKQIHKLNSDLIGLQHKMADKNPLFIGVDMEGGRVHRLKSPFTKWPALRKLGDLDSTSLAFKFAQNMGNELSAAGFNLDYAPCVDIFTNPANEIIGDRSISSDPETVSRIASALVRGYIKSNIVPCAKHFPGHGNTLLDSHESLPIEETTLDVLKERELIPFKKIFRARLDLVMTAHIKYPNIDSEWPVTLSKTFITDLIRNEYRYKNVVMTDDLDMKALRNHYSIEVIAPQALKAGCDVLLYCNEFDSPGIGIEACKKAVSDGKLSEDRINESYERVMTVKKKLSFQKQPLSWSEAEALIGNAENIKLAQAIDSGNIPDELKSTT